jgi:hypothetical protein
MDVHEAQPMTEVYNYDAAERHKTQIECAYRKQNPSLPISNPLACCCSSDAERQVKQQSACPTVPPDVE